MTETLPNRPVVRPMTVDDVGAVYLAATRAFADEDEAARRTPEEVERRQDRFRNLLKHDPGGSFVADSDGKVVGVAVAILREGLWILSLFVVEEDFRASGVGRELMQHALAYGEGWDAGMIASSTHPAAMRSYANAGFDLHPTFTATGKIRRENIPQNLQIREGSLTEDLALAEDVDRHLRGASHGPDFEYGVRVGAKMLVAERDEGRGYAIMHDGYIVQLGATSEEVATELLWASLAEFPENNDVEVRWITARQQWAIRVVLDAGLDLKPDGPICVKGDPGPLRPYIPSGPYL